MSYCLNPNCPLPNNPPENRFCQNCGQKLLLKERYHPIKIIGQGGFGKTLLAKDYDIPSQPYCVIKQFLPQTQSSKTKEIASKLFQQEAIQLDKLGKHPQIPALLAHFEENNQLYLIQEFIEGDNLAEELEKKGSLSEKEIWQILINLVPVLHFVHEQNIIHRDIKPENIIRRSNDEQLVLVDFGAAKFALKNQLNQAGTVIGTAGYAAPEQAMGKAIFASDIYSLGITCLYLLTHIEPFHLIDMTANQSSWRDYLPNKISDNLAEVLNKMVKDSLEERYKSALALLEAIEQKTGTQLTPKSRIKTSTRASKPSLPKLIQIESKHGYINYKGQMVIGPEYDQALNFSSDGLAAVKIINKWGYINSAGRIVLTPQFDEARNFAQDLAAFKVAKWLGMKQEWGYIDKTATVVIPPQFQQALDFSEDLAAVRLGVQWGYINTQGEMVINPQFDDAYEFKQGKARVRIGSKYGYIDKSGKVVIPPRDSARDFCEGLAAVKINSQWGYINTQGNIVIQPLFSQALDFGQKLAPVLTDIKLFGLMALGKKWGYINQSGQMIIDAQFDWALPFSQGLAAIKKNDKWGYINKQGLIIIEPQFDLADSFVDSSASVMIGNSYHYINKKGKLIY